MKNTNKKILVSLIAGAMLLASATAVSAAAMWGSRSSHTAQSSPFQQGNMGGMTSYAAKTNALSYADLTGGIISSEDLFSKRDLKQTADLSEAQTITVKSGSTIEITEEGVYVLTGTAANCTVKIEAAGSA